MKIRVLSYNIHKGFDPFNRHFILKKIRDLIRLSKADIVCLQEVVGYSSKLESKGQISIQAEFLADEVWSHFKYAQNSVYNQGHHGNLILSKYPIANFENINLSTNKLEKRGLLISEINLPYINKSLFVMTTHLNLLSKGRSIQYKKILKEISKYQGNPIILAGDFNDWNKRASKSFEDILKFEEVHKKKHGVYAKTFPAYFPFLSLDRIYVKDLQTISCEVVKEAISLNLSDHLPIITELDIS